jgi:hypothetical protein
MHAYEFMIALLVKPVLGLVFFSIIVQFGLLIDRLGFSRLGELID